jgi:hypothetical protein
MSEVLMRASIMDKKRIKHDRLPQMSETPVKRLGTLTREGSTGMTDERWNAETNKRN